MELILQNTNLLLDKYNINKIELEDELEAFIDYRTEPNKKGDQRYELEKTFCPNRRFRTWLRNNKKWARDTPKKSTTITTFW